MSINQYAPVAYRINSSLSGRNSYCVISPEDEFENALIEEIHDSYRQSPGRSYMRARLNGARDTLWMVPFTMNEERLESFLSAVEYSHDHYVGKPGFVFPLDVVQSGLVRAYMLRPIDRERSQTIRSFMPNVYSPRWEIAISVFRRVAQLHEMGLTSNGISREQMRVFPENNEVTIWLNETLSRQSVSEDPNRVVRHMGFLSVPAATEKKCRDSGIAISGQKRDVFSAAVTAFYLIMHSHPFVGAAFWKIVRSDYLNSYQNWPRYILEPGTDNDPGNQMLSRAVMGQWERTTAGLKKMFDSIFLAVTHPETWDNDAEYWDPQAWIRALESDAAVNDNESSRGEYYFENEMDHLV